MKPIFLLVSLLVVCGTLAAQPSIRTENSAGDKSTTFILEGNSYPGTLTIFLHFTDLYNCNSPRSIEKIEVVGNEVRLLTLRAADESYGVGYSFTWWRCEGRLDPKVDTAFVYRLPCSLLRPVRAIGTIDILDKYNIQKKEQQQQLGFMFPLEKGDTVYAMRRGVVTQVKIPEKPGAGAPAISYSSESVDICVEHPDGSMGRYICLDRGNLFAEEGDRVMPGTPLGLAGSYDGENYKVSVQTFWYKLDGKPMRGKSLETTVVPFLPRFATTEGVLIPQTGTLYTPVADEELLTREMTKRELKNRRAAWK